MQKIFGGLLFVFSLSLLACDDSTHYVGMIDAGSSSTRLYIYKYDKKENRVTNISTLASFRSVEPATGEKGIDQFRDDTKGLGAYLNVMTTAARERLTQDRIDMRAIPLWLKATAGMRTLNEDQKKRILDATSTHLSQSEFAFKNAQILTGIQEGQYAWIAVNTLRAKGNASDVVGVIELGGQSLQVAFPVKSINQCQAPCEKISANGQEHFVYAYSYDVLGSDSVRRILLSGECAYSPSATIANAYDDCFNTTTSWLENSNTIDQNLACESACPVGPLWNDAIANTRFVAIGSIASAAFEFSLSPFGSQKYDDAGDFVCGYTEAETKQRAADAKAKGTYPNINVNFLNVACLDLAYQRALLFGSSEPSFKGLLFPSTPNIEPVRNFQGESPSWPIGASLAELEK